MNYLNVQISGTPLWLEEGGQHKFTKDTALANSVVKYVGSLLLFVFAFWASNSIHAQNGAEDVLDCDTWDELQRFGQLHPSIGSTEDFEQWMSAKLLTASSRDESEVTTIPLVFHIIHEDMPIGTGDNLPQSQINAQVTQLNNDFGKIFGTSGWNDHPVGAASNIAFCLAPFDPNGQILAEPGINRINCNDMEWLCPPYTAAPASLSPSPYIQNVIKRETIWDPEEYLNIWVVQLRGSTGGYAQFPLHSGLPGLTPPDYLTGDFTDGIVVEPNTIGSTDEPSGFGPEDYQKGRFLTHEMGHFFGLRHIWGDGGCGVDDFCDDTPSSDRPNRGCSIGHMSCGSVDMVENYMDYSSDDCRHVFSEDQVARMNVVRENSPRRMFNQSMCNFYIDCESYGNHYIENNTEWDQSTIPNRGEHMGDIWVAPGVTLTINADISFASGARLHVLSGSKVILNSTLTSCDLWQGVRVFGNNANNTSGPGEFIANPGSVIENAVWGISTTDYGKWLGEGIIHCDGTIFRNNSSSAVMATINGVELTRRPFDATFRNCQFINNNDNRNDKFWVFIASYNTEGSINNPDGVLVENCRFSELQSNSTHPSDYNAGISTLNGNATIEDCYFEDLYFGVHARNGVGLFPNLDVLGTTFESCKYGVSNTGISGAKIEENDFLLHHNVSFPSKHDEWVGIILQDGMLGTRVENNSFDLTLDLSSVEAKGIYINDIGSYNTVVRKNDFKWMNYANVARGDNANDKGGLHYLCNTNQRNVDDDFMAFGGVALRKDQGWKNPFTSIFDPSGNTFSKEPFPGVDWHFENISAAEVDYYYNPTEFAQTPTSYTGITLDVSFDDSHCSQDFRRPELESSEDAVANEQLYQEYLPEYQAATQVYNQAVSEGNQALIDAVQATLSYEAQRIQEIIMLGLNYAHHTSQDRAQTRLWLARMDSEESDYLLAGDHFEHGEYQAGLAILHNMVESRELTVDDLIDHDQVISIYQQIADGALEEFDSAFEDELIGYADAGDGRSSFIARTLLINVGTYYDPITDVPSGGVGERRGSMDTEVAGFVYPNPATDMVHFDLSQMNDKDRLPMGIMIYDGLGRLITSISVPGDASVVQWSTAEIGAGAYLYEIQSKGVRQHVGQVVIVK